MTDQDLTAARAAIVRVMELLERAESKGASAVYVADIRGAIRDQGDVAPPAPSRTPQPGDVVLIPATVVATDQSLPPDVVAVHVPGWTTTVEMTICSLGIHEVLGPPWWPPQSKDVVLDDDGDAWQYDGRVWCCSGRVATFDRLGPVTLLARDGKRWEG